MQERNKKNICIIGSGFAGLSAATHLIEEGNNDVLHFLTFY